MQKFALILSGFALGVAGTAGAVLKGSAIFSDVPSNAYYDAAVGEMYNAGIIKGYEGTSKFGPDDYVTRGQVAVMMQRLRNDILGEEASASSRSSRSSSSSSSSSSSTAPSNPKGSLRLTTAAFSVDEKASDVTITVIRAEGNDEDVTVEYEVTAGTATADSDFEIISGTLRFADGEATKTFNVAILEDTASEGAETVNIKLLNPTNGATLGNPSSAVLTIKASDGGTGTSSTSSTANTKGTLDFSAIEYHIAENAGTLTVTVERTGGSTSSVGVTYATSNGTANNENYNSANGTLSFGNGETSKTFTITVLNNDAVGGNKTVNLTLSEVTGGASLGTQKTAKVIIVDDEVATSGSGTFKFDDDTYVVGESQGYIDILIKRTGGAAGEIAVNYATQSGTAKAGTDFTEKTGTLTFRSGEAQKTVRIPILSDDNDPNEAFSFHLTSNNGSLIGTPSSTSIQIDQ